MKIKKAEANMHCNNKKYFRYEAMYKKIKTNLLLAVFTYLLILSNIPALSQNDNVGIGTTTPNASALLDLVSTNKGFLAPRMTEAQKNAIASPATGLIVFQTNGTPGFYYFDGTGWLRIVSNTAAIPFDLISSGTNTTAAMLVGDGSSLAPTGTGYIQSNRFVGSGSLTDAVDLATGEVAGILSVANGGTGINTAPLNGLLLGNGTDPLNVLTTANSSYLITNGTGVPQWSELPSGGF